MEELLPYFERELGFLKEASREFAERYPKLGAELGLMDQSGQDPHIKRLMEASALLNARIAKRLDDDYPELTESLLASLYPHFLRSLPPCSIVQLEVEEAAATPGKSGAAVQGAAVVPRGTEMVAQTEDFPCRFRTTSDVVVAPVTLAQASFAPIIEPAALVRYPQGVTSKISMTFECKATAAPIVELGIKALPLFVDGDASFGAALLDCLFMRTAAAYLELPGGGPWRLLDKSPLALGGFSDAEALIPSKPSENPAYRLLTEYFGFPEKFNFIKVDYTAFAHLLPKDARRVTLHFAVTGLSSDSSLARVLRPLSPRNLLLACTPVINLFRQSALPIRITHTSALYDVVPSSNSTEGFEVYSVDSVHVIRTANGKQSNAEFRPYYALRHGERQTARDRFWFTRRDELQASISPGRELKIGFVDIEFTPSADDACIASVETTCSNRDRACAMQFGAAGGDLKTEGDALGLPVRMLRKPTSPQRFAAGKALHWRLIAQLALNHRSLASVDAFREVLALYDVSQSASSQRQIGGVAGIEASPATAWIRNEHGAALVHGTRIRMTVDEAAFAGSGLYAFAEVVNHFFGLYVHLNSFTQLVVLSLQTGKELLRCEPRNGSLTLV